MRERTGSIVVRKIKDERGKVVKTLIYARVTYVDKHGKVRNLWRKAENRTDARRINKELLANLENKGEESFSRDKATFEDLCDYYEANHAIPAEYHGDRKVRGLRYYKNARGMVRVLRAYFGRVLLHEITHADIEKFKLERLKAKTRYGTERSIVTVNRELTLLNTMLGKAIQKRWIDRNPFKEGDPLISLAEEKHRDRILSYEEEERLLAACDSHPQRAHLKPIVICALETGMRQGEIFKLRWSDVDFERRVILAVSYKGKTRMERLAPMTDRLYDALKAVYETSMQEPDGLIFGVTSNVKRSWASVKKLAGIEGFTFHDTRHCAATRMVNSGIPLTTVARVLGHRQIKTTYRYTNLNDAMLDDVRQTLNRQRAARTDDE